MIRGNHAAKGEGGPPLPLRILIRSDLRFAIFLSRRMPPKLPGAVLAVAHRSRLRQDALGSPTLRTEFLEPDKVLRAPRSRRQTPQKRLP